MIIQLVATDKLLEKVLVRSVTGWKSHRLNAILLEIKNIGKDLES